MKSNDLIPSIVTALMVGILLLLIGWLKSDIDTLNVKVDQLIQAYVQTTGQILADGK